MSNTAKPLAAFPDQATARRAMIDSQLRTCAINQPWLLTAFEQVAREDYLPASAHGHAYIDRAITVNRGQTMPAPLAQAMLLAAARPQADDRVLVISAFGYLAALVEPGVHSVETVTAAEALVRQARPMFSLVLIDGAIAQLPANLVAALTEGGRVVTGLVERGVTRLALGTSQGGSLALKAQAEVGFPVLDEFAAPKRWSF